MGNATKAEQIARAQKELDEVAAKQLKTLQLYRALPDGLQWLFGGAGLGYMADAQIVIELKNLDDLIQVTNLVPPISAVMAKEGVGWAASFIPECSIERWGKSQRPQATVTEVCPIALRASCYVDTGNKVAFEFFGKVEDLIVKFELRTTDRKVFDCRIYGKRYDRSTLISAQYEPSYPFQDATLSIAGGTPGMKTFTLTWPVGTNAEGILSQVGSGPGGPPQAGESTHMLRG